MTDRPILFSAPMVLAILDGQKTQTRRVMKPQPHFYDPAEGFPLGADRRTSVSWKENHVEPDTLRAMSPYGGATDRLWVRETCRAEERESDHLDGVRYFADDYWRPIENTAEAANKWLDLFHYGKHGPAEGSLAGASVPSIHMPRWASRILLEIESIRVERLNDCSEADALAEGSQHPSLVPIVGAGWSSRDMYARLWEHINGAGSWAANPWVWVVEFKRVQP